MLGFCTIISGWLAAKDWPAATICRITMPSTGDVTRLTGLFTTARSDERVNTFGNMMVSTAHTMNSTTP
ncbi:hypothetical protein D3C72_1495260 [compost metagenome]